MKAIALTGDFQYVTINGARAHIMADVPLGNYLKPVNGQTLCATRATAIILGSRLVNDFEGRKLNIDIQEVCPECVEKYNSFPHPQRGPARIAPEAAAYQLEAAAIAAERAATKATERVTAAPSSAPDPAARPTQRRAPRARKAAHS